MVVIHFVSKIFDELFLFYIRTVFYSRGCSDFIQLDFIIVCDHPWQNAFLEIFLEIFFIKFSSFADFKCYMEKNTTLVNNYLSRKHIVIVFTCLCEF